MFDNDSLTSSSYISYLAEKANSAVHTVDSPVNKAVKSGWTNNTLAEETTTGDEKSSIFSDDTPRDTSSVVGN